MGKVLDRVEQVFNNLKSVIFQMGEPITVIWRHTQKQLKMQPKEAQIVRLLILFTQHSIVEQSKVPPHTSMVAI